MEELHQARICRLNCIKSEPSEEKEAKAEDKDAGQPEADVTLGEEGLGSDRDTGDYRLKKMLQGVPLKY